MCGNSINLGNQNINVPHMPWTKDEILNGLEKKKIRNNVYLCMRLLICMHVCVCVCVCE